MAESTDADRSGVASRLSRLLDQAARRKRIPARLPIHYTEHGWQTKPDLIFGVTDDHGRGVRVKPAHALEQRQLAFQVVPHFEDQQTRPAAVEQAQTGLQAPRLA